MPFCEESSCTYCGSSFIGNKINMRYNFQIFKDSFNCIKTAQAALKSYRSQKPASKKCDCPYCCLKGDDAKSTSSSAVKKPASLIGNPKYKWNSPSAKESSSRIIGNGSVTIEKKTSTDSSWKNKAPKPDPEDSPSTFKVEHADAATSDPPLLMELNKCECGNSYSRKDNLLRHVKFCEVVKANSLNRPDAAESSKIKCECGMGFDCVYSLVRHKKENCTGRKTAGKPFKCECRFVFDDYGSLLNHQKTVCKKREHVGNAASSITNSVKREENFLCECGLSYTSYSTLLRHKNTACVLNLSSVDIVPSELPCCCECGRKFARTSDLTRHKSICDLRDNGANDLDVEVKEEDDDDGRYNSSQTSNRKRDNAGGNSNSCNRKCNGRLSCRCGKSYSSYSALMSHRNESCRIGSDKDAEGCGTYKCGCGREFGRLCHLGRHMTCSSASKGPVDSENKFDEDADDIKCECGIEFGKRSGLVRHKKTTCRLRKKFLSSSLKGSKSGRKKSELMAAANRCKCGTQFPSQGNLNRHIQRNCRLNKAKSKSIDPRLTAGRRNVSKVHVRGSRVVHSRMWGILRGPPFVCKCGSSYLHYEGLSFHKRNTCKIGDAAKDGKTSKPQKKPDNEPAKEGCNAAEVKLERMDMTDYPEVGKVFDLSTAVKFKCECGEEFYSKFSLNGHSRHCKDFLAKKRTPEKCSSCKATFSSRAHLVRHVKYMHCGVSNIKVGAKVKKIVAKTSKSSPNPKAKGLVIADVRSLANSS